MFGKRFKVQALFQYHTYKIKHTTVQKAIPDKFCPYSPYRISVPSMQNDIWNSTSVDVLQKMAQVDDG